MAVATFDGSTGQGTAPDTEYFDGTRSYSTDANHWIAALHWDFGDGSSSNEAWTTHVFTAPGDYLVTLTAIDDAGQTGTATLQIHVTGMSGTTGGTTGTTGSTTGGTTGSTVVAVATLDGSNGQGIAPDTEYFDATRSYSTDPNHWIASVRWDFGDGASSDAAWTEHVFTTPGDYTVVLTAFDDLGRSATASLAVHVAAPAACSALRPASIPTPITVPLNYHYACMGGFSDDEGNGLLEEVFEAGSPAITARFFTYSGGAVTDTGNSTGTGDLGTFAPQAQPNGYVAFTSVGSGARFLQTYSAGGIQTASVQLTPYMSFWEVAVASAIPGTLYAGVTPSDGATPTTLQRYDASLQPQGTPLTFTVGTSIGNVGVSRSGHVLVLFTAPGGTQQGRWYTADLVPLTATFAAPVTSDRTGAPWRNLVMLADGALALRSHDKYEAVFPDGQARMDVVPGWLAAHGSSDLFPVRGFTGYAAVPPSPACKGQLELLTADGQSCGCVDTGDPIPSNVGANVKLGRDGTLFVPVITPGDPSCTFHWYPQLFE